MSKYYLLLIVHLALFPSIILAIGLDVTTSKDQQSNDVRSFIYFSKSIDIIQGIKLTTPRSILPPPIAFKFELKDPLEKSHFIQWKIRTRDKAYGRIKLVSNFLGGYKNAKPGRIWLSKKLSAGIKERHILEFYPKAQKHQPPLYKKGRGKNNSRRKYGGGTKDLNDYIYNPRLAYEVTVSIFQNKKLITTYTEKIQQDDKDLLRQEYINHYGRKRYGRGKEGEINVPTRQELSPVPSKIPSFDGGTITSSHYNVMVEDGMINLANKVAEAFEKTKLKIKNSEMTFVNLNNENLPVSKRKLWFTSGWRNPERNEWYSNAINGIHQRGAAIDLIPNERPGSLMAASTYWLLWQTLNNKEFNIPGYWQLESHGRPMKTAEYTKDISPKNGIPDAFDIADHLHIQLEEK